MDRAAGLNTAGFISGYRGSPLGAVDQELWRAKRFLDHFKLLGIDAEVWIVAHRPAPLLKELTL